MATRQHASAVVFDLDDTLFPERDYALSGFAAVAKAFTAQLATPASELFVTMLTISDGPDRARVYNALCDELRARGSLPGNTDSLVQDMVACHRSHSPRIELFPDAERALTRLAGRVRLGIISDGYLIAQRAKVDALGLRTRVDEIILTDQWGRDFWKPHARAFEEMSARLGVPHSACVYVADNVAKDFIAPRQLAWQTVLVRRPGGTYSDLVVPKGGQADVTLDSLDELRAG